MFLNETVYRDRYLAGVGGGPSEHIPKHTLFYVKTAILISFSHFTRKLLRPIVQVGSTSTCRTHSHIICDQEFTKARFEITPAKSISHGGSKTNVFTNIEQILRTNQKHCGSVTWVKDSRHL